MSSKFADPEWKAKWYKARWGEGYKSERAEKKVGRKVEELSMDVLESDVLAGMGDEEIREAVRIYMSANKKRAESRRRKKEGGTTEDGGPGGGMGGMEEGDHGRKRLGAKTPGNAQLAYETRRLNLAARKTKQPRGRPKKTPNVDEVSSEASKKKVLWRIEGRSISAKAAKIRVEQALSDQGPLEIR